MERCKINEILTNTAYVRMGGSAEELKCAQYLAQQCRDMGCDAHLESFEVDMAQVERAVLTVDGVEIPCKGYRCAGSGTVEAELYYMRHNDSYSLSQCKGKIVLSDGYLGYWRYQDLLASGAVGFITYDGNVSFADRDMDDRELRSYVSNGKVMPGVNINIKDAVELVRKQGRVAKIELEQTQWKGVSQNVVAELPGEIPETIVLTAHYDSTSLSQGSYDNMSGSVGIMGILEYFVNHPHRYGIRMILCGSEERGLLGSKAYVAQHKEELEAIALCINLDMIGSIMGPFHACCTCEEKLCHYTEYFGKEYGMDLKVNQDVYSSDSTPFADAGVPAITFARIAPHHAATIHNRYDTVDVLADWQMEGDIRFVTAFADRMANSQVCPVGRAIPDNIKTRLDEYLNRKRPAGK